MSKRYWLMKTEPDVFSIDDLERNKTTLWEGVRNYQARNYMMKDMQVGDEVLFYHSNAKPPGLAGFATVSKLAVADPLQFDKKSKYYDKKATKEKPIWHCVEVQFKKKFERYISLEEIKAQKNLASMLVIKKGMRLSIQPVEEKDYKEILSIGLRPHAEK